jgi:hypothetical protein
MIVIYLFKIILYLAVKCNDDVNVIKLLAFFGAGFDCASKVMTKDFFDIYYNYLFYRVKLRKLWI